MPSWLFSQPLREKNPVSIPCPISVYSENRPSPTSQTLWIGFVTFCSYRTLHLLPCPDGGTNLVRESWLSLIVLLRQRDSPCDVHRSLTHLLINYLIWRISAHCSFLLAWYLIHYNIASILHQDRIHCLIIDCCILGHYLLYSSCSTYFWSIISISSPLSPFPNKKMDKSIGQVVDETVDEGRSQFQGTSKERILAFRLHICSTVLIFYWIPFGLSFFENLSWYLIHHWRISAASGLTLRVRVLSRQDYIISPGNNARTQGANKLKSAKNTNCFFAHFSSIWHQTHRSDYMLLSIAILIADEYRDSIAIFIQRSSMMMRIRPIIRQVVFSCVSDPF